jgi:hypothetical protein
MYTRHNFEGMTIGHESWFHYSSYSNSMFDDSKENFLSRIQQDIFAPKTMITIFFTDKQFLVLDIRSKVIKYN